MLQLAETDSDLQDLEQLRAEHEAREAAAVDLRRVVGTLGEVAAVLGVELGTVRDWRTGANPMPGDEGRYDLVEVLLWRCDRLKANAGNVKSPEVRELELRQLAADVGMRELKTRKARGELVSRMVAKAATAGILNDVRVQLEAIPELIGACVPPEMRDMVVRECRQQVELICQHMSNKAGE